MKRYTLLSLLLVLALAFTACAPGGGAPAAPAEEAPAAEAPAEAAAPPDLPFEVAPEAVNPFNIPPGTELEGIFFEGGYGRGYLDNAADIYRALHPDGSMTVEGIQRVGEQLRPRFIAGDPPDVIDNSGAGSLDGAALVAEGELLDLAPLFAAPSLDTPGKTFGETLFPGSQDAGVFDGTQYYLLLSYTLTGIWHSESLFEEMGWEYPKTWDEMLEFGDMVLETTDMYPWTYQGKFPGYMVWAVLMPLVYKNGGMETIIAMDNLEEGAFSSDAVRTSLEQIQELHTRGHILPGTEGLTHTESQAEWLQNKAVFIPCGTWLENEMRDLTPEDFNMVLKAVPGAQDESTASALVAWSGEEFIVPANGENPEAGMDYLRVLMSKANAKWFAQNVGAIMPVIGGTEGVELSPAVMSATAAAEAAGDDAFNYKWKDWYRDMSDEAAVQTGELLTGRITPDEWMEAMEAMAAQVPRRPGRAQVHTIITVPRLPSGKL